MKLSKKFYSFVIGMLLLSGSAFAQVPQPQNATADSLTDQELQNFVKTTKDVQALQLDIQSKMQDLIKEENMEPQRFQQIMQSKQNPQAAPNVEVTQEEEKTIQSLQPKLQEMGQKAQQDQISVIQANGLTVQRYQQIAQQIRSNPATMKKVQMMMQDTADKEMEMKDGN